MLSNDEYVGVINILKYTLTCFGWRTKLVPISLDTMNPEAIEWFLPEKGMRAKAVGWEDIHRHYAKPAAPLHGRW